MSNDVTAHAPLAVSLKGLKEQKLLEVELATCDGRLQNFTPLRDRLAASGQDATAMYRKIQARRDHVAAELKKLAPAPTRSRPRTAVGPLRPDDSVLSLPIVPGRIIQGRGPVFGYSGTVQMGRAQEGINVIPHGGQNPTSGSISAVARYSTGGIEFDGILSVGPSTEYDPSIEYFWLHNWNYLIFFPAPAGPSTLTYSFKVEVLAYMWLAGGPATFGSFVSTGHVADFVGVDVPVDTGLPWPFFIEDLSQPYHANGSVWNGHSGWVRGVTTVQGSFDVGGGRIPAVALVVGLASGQGIGTELVLDFPADVASYISPGTSAGSGLVNFHYAPVFENAPPA